MEPTSLPIPGVGVPNKDDVLDTTSDLLLGLPQEVWAVLGGLILIILIAQILNRLPFKPIAIVLFVVVVAMIFGSGK